MNHLTNLLRFLTTALLLAIMPLLHADYFSVYGISGELLENVQLRLKLLESQDKQGLINDKQLLNKNIVKAMQPYGYFKPQITINGHTITIEKGIAVKTHQIQLIIDGPGKKIFNNVTLKFPIKLQEPFVSEDYEKTKQMLFDIAEQHGYLDARMILSKTLINPEQHQALVLIHFDTGKRYYFGHTHFSKNTFYNPNFLKRYINYRSNMPYNTGKLLKLNEHLNGSGYFQQVNVKPNINKSSTTVGVHVHLKDKPSQNYTAGLGYGTDTGIRGRLGWQWLRVTPNGHTFKALFQGSQRQNALQAEYMIPGLNPVTDQYTLSANIFQLSYPVGKSRAQQLTIAKVKHKKNQQYTFSLNALQETFNFIGSNKLTEQALYPNIKYEIKKVSSPLFSKNGFVINIQARAANKNLASSISFAQIAINAKTAIYLPSQTRLFFRSNVGLTNTNNIYQLPISLQLLAGGSESIRGYYFQSIGPGKSLVVGSAEVQQQVKKNWYITAFYDVGDAYKPLERIWHRGIGGGMMWVSPVGPLRISLARAIDAQNQPIRIVFNMGSDL